MLLLILFFFLLSGQCFFKVGETLRKVPKLCRFKSDCDEIFSSKYASMDGVGFFYVTSCFQDGGYDVIVAVGGHCSAVRGLSTVNV